MQSQQSVHIVDDDAGVREALKSVIGAAGYQVRCYSSGAAFLDVCPDAGGCALIDLRLPDMSGIDLQQKVIAAKSHIDIIMMSAYADVELAVRAMRLGAFDFFEKPFDVDKLLHRIRCLMSAGIDAEEARREARQHAALVDLLTTREKQVLQMLVDGLANKQVAGRLGISPRTVETHRVHIMQKLQAESLPHLVRIWMTAGHHVEMPAP